MELDQYDRQLLNLVQAIQGRPEYFSQAIA
jgi:hypothetical protein